MSLEPTREREFLRQLVQLSTSDAPEALLRRSLSVLVALTGARETYVELHGQGEHEAMRWSAAEGCDAARVEEIQQTISRGILGEAIASGEILSTPHAATDARFKDFESIRAGSLDDAVLCAPIGQDEPIGAVYLRCAARVDGVDPFPPEIVASVELFTRAISPVAHLLVREQDETRSAQAAPDGACAVVITRNAAMRDLVDRLRLVASLELPVLLTGPSGAGKSLLAAAIHSESKRRARPLVDVNCAAIPEPLVENELFGAERGAHSAVPSVGVRGKIEAAEGGTLFLDEIAELPVASQAKLLQFLQKRSYYRLGSSTPRTADVRLIAATNADLPTAVAAGRFREDLYYRLKVIEARVPGLDERPEDIRPMASAFCREAAARHHLTVSHLSPGTLRTLATLTWPGNVRELAHRVESAVVNAHLRGATVVEPRDVVEPMAGESALPATLQEATRAFQRKHVQATLDAVDWNVSEAARQLDVARSHLYALIRSFGLARGD